MYEETIRLEDGSRVKTSVGLHACGYYGTPRWCVYVSLCKKRGRNFDVVRELSTVDSVDGEYAEQIKSALYSAWLEIKPEPIK